MHLIIGGAYMGKFTHAVESYGFSEDRVCDCEKEALRIGAACVRHLEQYVLDCVQRGEDPSAVFRMPQTWVFITASAPLAAAFSNAAIPSCQGLTVPVPGA